uniref:Uncharacterized protein n=1 Tax=Strigamia maritima TaxID=126957 RepID=T1JFL7_STRMM
MPNEMSPTDVPACDLNWYRSSTLTSASPITSGSPQNNAEFGYETQNALYLYHFALHVGNCCPPPFVNERNKFVDCRQLTSMKTIHSRGFQACTSYLKGEPNSHLNYTLYIISCAKLPLVINQWEFCARNDK